MRLQDVGPESIYTEKSVPFRSPGAQRLAIIVSPASSFDKEGSGQLSFSPQVQKDLGVLKIDFSVRNFMPKRDDGESAERRSKIQKPVSHLVVLGHPGESSFNAAIAHQYGETVQANHQEVVLRDLYALGFNPLLDETERTANSTDTVAADVRIELDLIEQCDVLTFVFPLWFGMPPAIIKGYVDRVLGAGFKSNEIGKAEDGAFQGKQLAVLTTSASTLPWLEAHGMWISLCQSFDHYMGTVFGFSASGHYHAGSIVDDLSPLSAQQILHEVSEFARDVCAKTAMLHR